VGLFKHSNAICDHPVYTGWPVSTKGLYWTRSDSQRRRLALGFSPPFFFVFIAVRFAITLYTQDGPFQLTAFIGLVPIHKEGD
jgi:hypothetical protein